MLRTRTMDNTATGGTYPRTEAGWAARYDTLWRAYTAEDYSTAEAETMALFVAKGLDDTEVLDITRRIYRHFPFVVGIDARSFVGSGLILEMPATATDRDAMLRAGEAVWRRSRGAQEVIRWITRCAAMGDAYVAAVRTNARRPYASRVVGWDARCVVPTYDAYGDLIHVAVEVALADSDVISAVDGTLNEVKVNVERWEFDRNEVKVYVNGVADTARSGVHGLGVVPVVHLQWQPWTEPEHGLPAGHPLDQALALLNSLTTQIKAVGNRNANPIMKVRGGKLGGEAIGQVGRVINIPDSSGDVDYITPNPGIIPALLDQIKVVLDHVERTLPEFLFADSSGQESGTAKGYRAAAFETLINEARGRILPSLAQVVEYAVCLDLGTKPNPDAPIFRFDAPPVLPRNVRELVETLALAGDNITRVDKVKHLQAAGLADNTADPAQYAAQAADEVAMGNTVPVP